MGLQNKVSWDFYKAAKKIGLSKEVAWQVLRAFLRTRRANLSSFWIHLVHLKIERISISDVQSQFMNDRFCKPSNIPQDLMLRIELLAFDIFVPKYEAIEVSPLVPFGAYSAIQKLDSSTYLHTDRMNSLIADPGYSLCALSVARFQKDKHSDKSFLCCSTRVIRAQRFQHNGYLPHFKMFGFFTRYKRKSPVKDAQSVCTEHIEKVASFIQSVSDFHEKKCEILIELSNSKLARAGFNLNGVSSEEVAKNNRVSDPKIKKTAATLEERFTDTSEIKELLGTKALKRSEHLENWRDDFKANLDPRKSIEIKVKRFRPSGIGYYNGLMWKIYVKSQNSDWIAVSDGGEVNWAEKLSGIKSMASSVGGVGLEALLSSLDISK